MAENEDLDLDVKPASNKKMLIIMAVVGVLLIVGSVGLTVWLVGGGGDEAEEGQAAQEQELTRAQYLPLETMVVNFAQKGPANYLQVDIQLMTNKEGVSAAVEEHMPVIRNDILVMLGSQSYEGVSSREGKERLRQEILVAVNRILKEQTGNEGIQAVYFTNFVMQ